MLKRLKANELIRRCDGHRIGLTEHGTRHALDVVRRHRLPEVLLAEVLGEPWDEVHAEAQVLEPQVLEPQVLVPQVLEPQVLEAQVLEHGISAELEGRIDALLGHPTRDPHGGPIPSPAGEYTEDWGTRLADTPAGSRFQVERVRDRDRPVLRHLAELGLRPGAVLTVIEWAPFGGPLWIEVDGRRHPLGSGLVQVLYGRTI